MNNDNQLIYSTRTEQIAARRDEAMQKFEQGMRLIAEASALAEISLFHPDIMKPNIFGLPESLESTLEMGRCYIDRTCWQKVFKETKLDRLWNHEQTRAFYEQLREKPPVISLAVLKSTLRDAIARRKETLSEGFVTLLTRLNRTYKNNTQTFTMTSKLILPRVFEPLPLRTWNCWAPQTSASIRDLENIICICSGQQTPGPRTDMTDLLLALRNKEGTGEIRNSTGWRCKVFANGNVHVLLDDQSLISSLNDLISHYFSGQLPAKG